MKSIGNLLDNVSTSEIVQRDVNTLLDYISLNTTDPVVTIQINFVKWLGLPEKLNDTDVVTITSRFSEAKEEENQEIERRKTEGWEVSLRTETCSGVSFANKQELVALKKHLMDRSSSNQKKVEALHDLLNDFISSYTTYGKNAVLLETAYYTKLHIYPMVYLNKILTTDYWGVSNFPSLAEVEQALRYCDGLKSQALWEINSAVADTTDYGDEL